MGSSPANVAKSAKKSPGVTWVSFWLLLSAALPFYQLLQLGEAAILSPSATMRFAYVLVATICAIGLLARQDWARRASVLFFVLYFFWAVWSVNLLAGPAFDSLAKIMAEKFAIAVVDAKEILLGMFVVYIFWSVLVIFYLTCPAVRIKFGPQREGLDEQLSAPMAKRFLSKK